MATIPHSDVSQQRARSQVGRLSGTEEVREPEVLWCEMPGAVIALVDVMSLWPKRAPPQRKRAQ